MASFNLGCTCCEAPARKKNTTHSVAQLMHRSISAKHRALPSAGSQVTTRRLHNQTPSVVSVPLKIPRVQSLNVFSVRPDSDEPEHNDIFRDGSTALQKAMPWTDVSVYNYINQDTLSERQPVTRAGCCGFQAKALGNIRFSQLSLPHLRYLNISEHEHTRRVGIAWRVQAIAGLITGSEFTTARVALTDCRRVI